MPNRIIKESICTSDSVDRLSWFEECLFYRLIVNCDDYGRYDGRPAIIKNRLFPLKEDLTICEVSDAIQSLVGAELVALYIVGGRPYLQLVTWDEHQRIRAKRSKFPSPSDGELQTHDSNLLSNDSELLTNASVIQSNPIQSESESKRRFTPPSFEDVKAYCDERDNGVDPQAFIDFYTSKGWKIGKETMKDWQAAVRTWERREQPKKRQYTTASEYKPPNSKIDADKLKRLKEMMCDGE